MGNTESSRSKQWEVAYNFVNRNAGNKRAAYIQYYQDHNLAVPKCAAQSAYSYFEREDVKELVEQFRAENRVRLNGLRDENVAILKEICTSEKTAARDRISAVRELNSMCGYNQQNINVGAETNIVIDIKED